MTVTHFPYGRSQHPAPPRGSTPDDHPLRPRDIRPLVPGIAATLTKAERRHAVDILARTVWGEARGEGLAGMEAVAAVVLHRVAKARARRARTGHDHWWGGDVAEVCLKPWQFSCWNPADPNRAKLLVVTEANPAFRVAKRVAIRAVGGVLRDRVRGAMHYHASNVLPAWARGRKAVVVIGHHLFYRDID